MQVNSIVLISSMEMINKYHSDVLIFFSKIDAEKKSLIVFSQKPILDYSEIKKISVHEMMILYPRDFLLWNLALKPNVVNVLNKKPYSVLIHFNEKKFIRNTFLISKNIIADIKITNTNYYSNPFSIIISDNKNYFNGVIECVKRLEF